MSNLIVEFCKNVNDIKQTGDVLEFGTGWGASAGYMGGELSKNLKIHTFDGFQGLPKTSKVIPDGTEWYEGNYNMEESETREKLAPCKNVIVHATMTCDLKEPHEYGIKKIIAANMDMDLYESTVDGLNFIEKCEWDEIILRFDDWGCFPHQDPTEVFQHEELAFNEWIERTGHTYAIDSNLLKVSLGMQSIIYVKRKNK